MNHALAAQGMPTRPRVDLYHYVGPPLAVVFAEILEQDVEAQGVSADVARYRARYAEMSLRETAAVPGVSEVLADLARAIGLP